MSKPKLSPWFSAKTQPPVNGGPNDRYEIRCVGPDAPFPPRMTTAKWIGDLYSCKHCQWRGVLK